jgi:hypothetical protein
MSTMTSSRRTITHADWLAEAVKRFGQDAKKWKFVCPACNTLQCIEELLTAGVPKDKVVQTIGFSCIGRFDKNKGCDWTLGGLLHIHTLEVIHPESHQPQPVFEFYKGEVNG